MAGAIPGSSRALTWPLQLVAGKQPHAFSIHSKEPAANTLPVPLSMAWPHGEMMGAKRGEDLLHASCGKGMCAMGHGAS